MLEIMVVLLINAVDADGVTPVTTMDANQYYNKLEEETKLLENMCMMQQM